MKKRIRGIRVGSSDLKARRADINEAHKEIQRLEAEGWKIESVRKRPRVKPEPKKREPKMVIIIYENTRMRVDFKALSNYEGATVEFEIY